MLEKLLKKFKSLSEWLLIALPLMSGCSQLLYRDALNEIAKASKDNPPRPVSFYHQMIESMGWKPSLWLVIATLLCAIAHKFLRNRGIHLSLCNAFSHYMHERVFSSNIRDLNIRVSIWVPNWNNTKLIALCRSDTRKPRKSWDISDKSLDSTGGLARFAYLNRIDPNLSNLPDCIDWANTSPQVKADYCRRTMISEDVAEKLTWRARSYRANWIKGEDKEPCGLVMLESLDPSGLNGSIVGSGQKLARDTFYISQILYYTKS